MTRMNINYICRKLVKNNKKQYAVLLACLLIGTMLSTSLGLLVFSPVIRDNTAEGGTTRSIAYIIYGITMLGSIMFILYAHSLFMKYKSREIGLFISLGMSRVNIKRILLKELSYILPIGVTLGILGGIPTVYLFWGFISKVIGATSLPYVFSWIGLIGGAALGSAAIFLINAYTSKNITKIDILTILRQKEQTEETRVGNYSLGIIGLIAGFVGAFGWDKSVRGLWFPDAGYMSTIFAGMIPIGLYLFAMHIGSLGALVKIVSLKKYYKNIMFYNLLKLKGRQYSKTLYTVIFLISVTVFVSCLSFIGPLAGEEIVDIKYPFDFSIRKTIDQNNNIEKDIIYQAANKHGINIEYYNEFELIQLAKRDNYQNLSMIWNMTCIKEDVYNLVYDDNIDVKPGHFVMFAANKNSLQLKYNKIINAMIIGTEISQQMKMQGAVHKILLEGGVSSRRDFFVLDNNDYDKFKAHSLDEAIETQIVFNVSNWKDSEDFYFDLKSILLSINTQGIRLSGDLIDKYFDGNSVKYVEYQNITNRDYDNWSYRLEAKIAGFAEDKFKSIYYMLFFYIGLLSVISAAMILFIKILNVSWQDNEIYFKLSLLGADRRYIKSLITKQLTVIFFVPTVLGMIFGALIASLMNSGVLYSYIFVRYAIIIDLVFLFLQAAMFLYTRYILISFTWNKSKNRIQDKEE